MQFEFLTPTRIIFGLGSFSSLAKLTQGFGNSVLVLHGGPGTILNRLIELLSDTGIKSIPVKITNEPSIDSIRLILDAIKGSSFDSLIAIGGGSVIDTAKAVSALLTNPGDITDFLEVIGENKPILNDSLPLIAVPTTAGTGSEVTKNAVISSSEHHVKVSLRSQSLFPRIALVDPELTLTLPPQLTAFSGLDALTQLIEAYTCKTPNPITDALALEGIQQVAASFESAYNNGSDVEAREHMSLASLLSGICLANAKLGAVHGLAGPIGGELSAPHGAICASLLPHVMTANMTAMLQRAPGHPVLMRYKQIAEVLTGDKRAKPIDGIQWIQDSCQLTRIPKLSYFGLIEENFDSIIGKSMEASSMKGNPIILLQQELRSILYKSI